MVVRYGLRSADSFGTAHKPSCQFPFKKRLQNFFNFRLGNLVFLRKYFRQRVQFADYGIFLLHSGRVRKTFFAAKIQSAKNFRADFCLHFFQRGDDFLRVRFAEGFGKNLFISAENSEFKQ